MREHPRATTQTFVLWWFAHGWNIDLGSGSARSGCEYGSPFGVGWESGRGGARYVHAVGS